MSWEFLLDQFATQFGLWWVIWPAILLGIVVGILPGFSPQNTLIMLLPLTLSVPVEQAMAFMIALYCANHLAGGRRPGGGRGFARNHDPAEPNEKRRSAGQPTPPAGACPSASRHPAVAFATRRERAWFLHD